LPRKKKGKVKVGTDLRQEGSIACAPGKKKKKRKGSVFYSTSRQEEKFMGKKKGEEIQQKGPKK